MKKQEKGMVKNTIKSSRYYNKDHENGEIRGEYNYIGWEQVKRK